MIDHKVAKKGVMLMFDGHEHFTPTILSVGKKTATLQVLDGLFAAEPFEIPLEVLYEGYSKKLGNPND